jgi:hypothetical protein
MWIMTQDGFVSIVEKPEDAGAGTLTVRARNTGALVAFCEYAGVNPEETIIETEGTDYPYRVVMTRDDVTQALVLAVSDIDYVNFKTRAKKVGGEVYERFLMRVWVAGLNLTPWRDAERLKTMYRSEDFV